MRLHWSKKGNVWPAASRHFSTRVIRKKTQCTWLLRMHCSSGTMDAYHLPDQLHAYRRWFWYQICWWRTCKTPVRWVDRALRDIHWLVGVKIHWTQFRLGLYLPYGSSIHAWIHREKLLICFNHDRPKRKQHSPHPHVLPTYGAKAQYAEEPTPSPSLSKEDKKYVQALRALCYTMGERSTQWS